MNPGSLSAGHFENRLWSSVGKLLRLRLVIWTGTLRRAPLRRKFSYIILAVVIVIGFGFIFYLSWQILKFLQSPGLANIVGDTAGLIESVPVFIMSAAFIGILLTSFGVLLQALYLAGDMDFLLSSPVPIRAVFISKLLQAILPNFGLVLVFVLPILFGLGFSNSYPVIYYVLVLVLLGMMALAAGGLASLLVMFIVRIFPPRRVAEVLGLVVGISSFLCSQSGQLANWDEVDPQQASQALDSLSRFNSPWIPLTWPGRGLVSIGQGEWLPGIGLIALALLLGGGLFAISLFTAEKLYYSGWANMQVKTRRKKPGRKAGRASTRPKGSLRWIQGLLPPPVWAIFRKDSLVLRRDLRNLSQLITPLILGVVYAVMLIRRGDAAPAGRGEAPEWFNQVMTNLVGYANVGLALFVSWMLLSRLAIVGFSQEGRSYWVLKASPVRAGHMLAAKFMIAYLPSLGMSWTFLLVISILRSAQLSATLYGLFIAAASIAGMAGLNLSFGVLGAKFDWDDPRRMSAGGFGCLGAMASVTYLALSLGLFFLPPILVSLLGGAEVAGQWIGAAVGLLFCGTCAFLPLYLVRQRVERLMEA